MKKCSYMPDQSIFNNLFAFWMCMLIGLTASCHADIHGNQPSKTANTTPAAEVLQNFYHWYLDELAQDKSPINDDQAALHKYVSEKLIGEIEKRMKSEDGMDSDYFTKAQDYFDDWSKNITVSDLQSKGDSSFATVKLGTSKESLQYLNIKLIMENGVWKISQVDSGTSH